jgi:hypothetical protein
VCAWNLAQLGSALLGAGLVEKEDAQEALELYSLVGACLGGWCRGGRRAGGCLPASAGASPRAAAPALGAGADIGARVASRHPGPFSCAASAPPHTAPPDLPPPRLHLPLHPCTLHPCTPQVLTEEYNGRMAAKMGTKAYSRELALGLVQLMYADEADFTNTFRALAGVPTQGARSRAAGSRRGRVRAACCVLRAACWAGLRRARPRHCWRAAVPAAAAHQRPARCAPHLRRTADLAPQAAARRAGGGPDGARAGAGLAAVVRRRLGPALRRPQRLERGAAPAAAHRCPCWPAAVRSLGALSAHSKPPPRAARRLAAYQQQLQADGLPEAERTAVQRAASPKYIPRQHLLQWAIEAAEAGDFSKTRELLDVLRRCAPGRSPAFPDPGGLPFPPAGPRPPAAQRAVDRAL